VRAVLLELADSLSRALPSAPTTAAPAPPATKVATPDIDAITDGFARTINQIRASSADVAEAFTPRKSATPPAPAPVRDTSAELADAITRYLDAQAAPKLVQVAVPTPEISVTAPTPAEKPSQGIGDAVDRLDDVLSAFVAARPWSPAPAKPAPAAETASLSLDALFAKYVRMDVPKPVVLDTSAITDGLKGGTADLRASLADLAKAISGSAVEMPGAPAPPLPAWQPEPASMTGAYAPASSPALAAVPSTTNVQSVTTTHVGGSTVNNNVVVNNPEPEPASVNIEERLRILAATAIW
jgi:hypothetical protein